MNFQGIFYVKWIMGSFRVYDWGVVVLGGGKVITVEGSVAKDIAR